MSRAKDEQLIREALQRLVDLHKGGNDPRKAYARRTRIIARNANGAFRRVFKKGGAKW